MADLSDSTIISIMIEEFSLMEDPYEYTITIDREFGDFTIIVTCIVGTEKYRYKYHPTNYTIAYSRSPRDAIRHIARLLYRKFRGSFAAMYYKGWPDDYGFSEDEIELAINMIKTKDYKGVCDGRLG